MQKIKCWAILFRFSVNWESQFVGLTGKTSSVNSMWMYAESAMSSLLWNHETARKKHHETMSFHAVIVRSTLSPTWDGVIWPCLCPRRESLFCTVRLMCWKNTKIFTAEQTSVWSSRQILRLCSSQAVPQDCGDLACFLFLCLDLWVTLYWWKVSNKKLEDTDILSDSALLSHNVNISEKSDSFSGPIVPLSRWPITKILVSLFCSLEPIQVPK